MWIRRFCKSGARPPSQGRCHCGQVRAVWVAEERVGSCPDARFRPQDLHWANSGPALPLTRSWFQDTPVTLAGATNSLQIIC